MPHARVSVFIVGMTGPGGGFRSPAFNGAAGEIASAGTSINIAEFSRFFIVLLPFHSKYSRSMPARADAEKSDGATSAATVHVFVVAINFVSHMIRCLLSSYPFRDVVDRRQKPFEKLLNTRLPSETFAFDWKTATSVISFEMIAFGQGFRDMTAPTKEWEKLVLCGKLRHGGHPVLRWMASNVAVEIDAAGNLKPSKKKSTERIDGIVAGIMGLGRAMLRPEKGSVYENEGIMFL